jgi:hypothetical protein
MDRKLSNYNKIVCNVPSVRALPVTANNYKEKHGV